MTGLGVALVVAALALLLAEAHLSTGGLIGTAASGAAVAGIALLLVAAGAGTAVVLIVAVCLAAAAVSTLIVARRRLLRSSRARPRTGREALVGRVGVIRSVGEFESEVFIDGSLWRAQPDHSREQATLHDGDHVVVEHVNGLTLRVRKAEEWELNP